MLRNKMYLPTNASATAAVLSLSVLSLKATAGSVLFGCARQWKRRTWPLHYKWLHSSSLSDPLDTSLCAYVPPHSLYCISPLAVTRTRLDSSVNVRTTECRSKRKYCSVHMSHLIRRNHSNRAVITEQFRRCCSCLSPNEAWLQYFFYLTFLYKFTHVNN